jgi:O-acetyl-ADP-ribose deacetylase (regulator of RNase III)
VIEYRTISIFDTDADSLVNPVNCVGVSGAGLAKQFAERFENNQAAYKLACDKGLLTPGGVYAFKSFEPPTWILNVATKDHWRDKSRLIWIRSSLAEIVGTCARYNIASVAIPKLGCGFGGLDWKLVSKLAEEEMAQLEWLRVVVALGATERDTRE